MNSIFVFAFAMVASYVSLANGKCHIEAAP